MPKMSTHSAFEKCSFYAGLRSPLAKWYFKTVDLLSRGRGFFEGGPGERQKTKWADGVFERLFLQRVLKGGFGVTKKSGINRNFLSNTRFLGSVNNSVVRPGKDI
ncbi:MAG: hypothetical protein N2645_19095 [Clostridia bacterium]|nr:hypothetical protein [Clostridia bacterium]